LVGGVFGGVVVVAVLTLISPETVAAESAGVIRNIEMRRRMSDRIEWSGLGKNSEQTG
jgi:hypothetical protein